MVFGLLGKRHETFIRNFLVSTSHCTPKIHSLLGWHEEEETRALLLVVYNVWETGMSTETNIRWLYSEDEAVI